jgi:hypothetical protein
MFKSCLHLVVLGVMLWQTSAFHSVSLGALPGCSRGSKISICAVRSMYGSDESPYNSQKIVSTKMAAISDQTVSVRYPYSNLLDNLWGSLHNMQV